ncbi:MAG: hypothetical protein K0V04_03740 [Deltaproteobacteria bacterium]|nr:hypothetical protein [Deltaproteobacteria bacterium]
MADAIAIRLGGLVCLALAGACADSPEPMDDEWMGQGESGPDDPEPEVVLPTDIPPPVTWREVGTLTVDDFGAAGTIAVPFPAGQRYVAVRSVPLDATTGDAVACHRVMRAQWSSGEIVVPEQGTAPSDGHQHLVPGPGAGVFVMSTNVEPLHEADTLELELGLFDCGLAIPASRARFPGMPRTVRVDVASEPEPTESSPTATVAVRLARAADSGWGPMAEDPALWDAWAVAVERFADIGIELRLEAELELPDAGVTEYGADMIGLASLQQHVHAQLQADPTDARFVPVALVRCLDYEDPTATSRSRPVGQATRIPGSLADAATPSLVVLAGGDCQAGPDATLIHDPARYGVVLAHEIGHYLGLFHVDTALGSHLPAAGDERLMASTIAQAIDPERAWFSPAQATVLLRHPDVVIGDR